MAEVEKISGTEGNFDVTIKTQPRFVNEKCTGCNKCAEACPTERSNDFDFGMSKTKAAYLPHNQAFPLQYVIDEQDLQGRVLRQVRCGLQVRRDPPRHEARDRAR